MERRFVGLLFLGHLATDVNQGALPALLPFLIFEHQLSYAAAAGIVFAANISSSFVQPLFGYAADRFSKPWLMPVGILLAGLGLALMGLVSSYQLIMSAAILSGIGVAAYHPEGARLVNIVAGERKATAMSLFGVGGTLGFAIGPLLTTIALLHWGLEGTVVLIVPVSVMAIVFATQLSGFSAFRRTATRSKTVSAAEAGKDAWAPFARLTITAICRSVIFYGLNIFIPFYWINALHQSKAAGGIALTIMATAGVIGTLVGGRLADRFGLRGIMLVGFFSLIPLVPALIWVNNVHVATLLLLPIGLTLSATYSPTIVLGQRYLPNHIGLSSGVTIGVAVAIGGVAAPVLGKIADHYGISSALATIASLPVLAVGLVLTLPRPRNYLTRPERENLSERVSLGDRR
jgi:FSR family fosmidomycin resistance protein-like MFS transporter